MRLGTPIAYLVWIFVVVGAPLLAHAQGTLTDANAEFSHSGSAGTFGLGDFHPNAPGGDDHMYQNWWYYRVQGDPSELNFPVPPPMQSYIGNQAVFNFSEAQFDAEWTIDLTGAGMNAAEAVHTMVITNTGATDLDLSLFCYLDLDVLGSGSDSAALFNGDPTHLRITDSTGAYSDFLAVNSTAYEVSSFPSLRTSLQDTTPTDLASTGVPFGPGDFTGAFQWDLLIPAGDTATVYAVITCNMEAMPPVVVPPVGQFVRGDCNNDGGTNLVDAVYYLGFLFPQGSPPNVLECLDACDGNDDGSLNLVDAVAILNALFGQPPVPLAGPLTCGPDVGMDNLTCDTFDACP